MHARPSSARARAAAFALLLALALAPLALSQSSAKPSKAVVERGDYLVKILACDDCHTPMKMGPHGPEPDMTRRLTGHPEGMKMGPPPAPTGGWLWAGAATNTAFAGPWGISYTTNLTPDENTGIGIWTEKMFVDAIRTGKHMGTSRMILPPMPWPAYRHLTDADLKAVYAYLRTLEPVKNRVPDAVEAPAPPAPANN
jgi:mono/diheme cytochrome c family protein